MLTELQGRYIAKLVELLVYPNDIDLMDRIERLLGLAEVEPETVTPEPKPEPVVEPVAHAPVQKPVAAERVPLTLEQMTRYEQLAYAITEKGGGAYTPDLVMWAMENELFNDETQAKNRISSTMSSNSDRFGHRDGKWYVKPGWYTHVKLQPVAPFVTGTNGKVKDCPMSPNGAHHWLIDPPNGPESGGKCKYCPSTTNGQKNSIQFSAWDRTLKAKASV